MKSYDLIKELGGTKMCASCEVLPDLVTQDLFTGKSLSLKCPNCSCKVEFYEYGWYSGYTCDIQRALKAIKSRWNLANLSVTEMLSNYLRDRHD